MPSASAKPLEACEPRNLRPVNKPYPSFRRLQHGVRQARREPLEQPRAFAGRRSRICPLDVAVAADQRRHRGQRGGRLDLARRQRRARSARGRPRTRQAGAVSMRRSCGIAEHVERGAAQPFSAREQPERLHHPRAEARLARLPVGALAGRASAAPDGIPAGQTPGIRVDSCFAKEPSV